MFRVTWKGAVLFAVSAQHGAVSSSSQGSGTCFSGCKPYSELILEAASFTGAPAAVEAFGHLMRAGAVAGDEDFRSCHLAALLVRLGRLYFAGPGPGADTLEDFLEALAKCDLDDDVLFQHLRLSRPQMAYAFWLMMDAPVQKLPQWLASLAMSSSVVRPALAFDLGAGRGDDAFFYLALNMSVVAVDAHPGAFDRLKGRPKLVTLSRALVADGGPPSVRFFSCKVDYTRSTTNAELGTDQNWCGDVEVLEVPSASCGSLVDSFWPPVHVKMDVETADLECLNSMLQRQPLPSTISVEAASGHRGSDDVEESLRLLKALREAGYDQFKLCRQALFNPPMWGGQMAASGPFGGAATDWQTGLKWRGPAEVAADFWEIARLRGEGRLLAEWFDLHAMKEPD